MLLLLGVPPAADADTPVEDWRGQPVGARGIPAGWEAYRTPGGRPAYDFSVVEADGRRALRMGSHGDRSTIARALRVDLAATPVLEWSWKVTRLPARADVRHGATSDAAAQLLVVWPRPPELIRSRIIAYTWDTTAPAQSIVPSPKARTVTFVVMRSGPAGLGRWLTERRDVLADHRRIYGEDPDPVGAIALSIDTNDTRSPAEAAIGPIAFRPAGSPTRPSSRPAGGRSSSRPE
jgi:hypothetical protein